jgi:CheY-like chemotaxis protein/HPt (histidine-containing phosphotransfer) domain-containing protein
MGGELWVESVHDAGSSFHFTMRVGTLAGVEPGRLAPVASMAGLGVLVVDDNATNRRILDEHLSALGLVVTTADGARAALTELWRARAEGRVFALIIMDYHMPDMDGLQLAERVREFPGVVAASIMMLTSGGQTGDLAKCRELGLAAYLTKPLSQRALYQVVAQVIGAGGAAPGFIVPATQKDVLAMSTSSSSTEQTPQPSLKVLLAEDNFVNQKLAVTMLQKRGHRVTVASDGIEALAQLDRDRFDVVLMDVHMPNMGGFEATQKIRENERAHGTRRVPIIALTALAMSGDREKCLQSGMDGYLTKPISASDLFAALAGALAPPAARSPSAIIASPAAAAPAAAASPGPVAPAVDLAELRSNMDDDEDMLLDIVGAFLRDHVTQLRDLRAGLASGDEKTALRTAHTLKGLLRTLAAEEAAEVAFEIEQQIRAQDLAGARARLPQLEGELARVITELETLKKRAA